MGKRMMGIRGFAAVLLALAGVVVLLLALPHPGRADPGLLCVAPGGVGCGATCSGACYASVQAAVDAALDDDEIRVAAGFYQGVFTRPVPSGYSYPPAGGVITQAVLVTKTLAIRGGYDLTFDGPPEPITNQVTLDAMGLGRVLVAVDAVSTTIDGLRMVDGDAAGQRGRDNTDVGGNIYSSGGSPILSSCQIEGGHATYAGGMYVREGAVQILANVIRDNRGTSRCGGLFVWGADDAVIRGNTIVSNAGGSGGGLYLQFSDALVEANTIISNTGYGGHGVYMWGADALFLSNVIADNPAWGGGTGVYATQSSPRFWHTTLARQGHGVTVWGADESLAMTNTILVGNGIGVNANQTATVRLEATLWGTGTWSNGLDWTVGSGASVSTGTLAFNRWLTPGFVDPDRYDYHLLTDSLAIDRGVGRVTGGDLDGDARWMGAAPDLGADEVDAETHIVFLPMISRGF